MKFSGKIALGVTITQNSEKIEIGFHGDIKTGNADFEAPFDSEGMTFCYQIHLMLDINGPTNFFVFLK